VFELPQAGRNSRGKPMVNLLPRGRTISHVAHQAFRRRTLRVHGHEPGHVKNTAVSLAAGAGIIASASTPTIASGVALTDGAAKSSFPSAAASRSASMKRKCGRWGARPRVRGIKLGVAGIDLPDRGGRRARVDGLGEWLWKTPPLAEDFPQHGRGGQLSPCRPPSATARWPPGVASIPNMSL
jgi:DNA gyrase subunit A